jgi:hypothetical protein
MAKYVKKINSVSILGNSPAVSSTVWGTITGTLTDQADLVAYVSGQVANGNTAFSWGNHAGLYSLLGHVHNAADITSGVLVQDRGGTGFGNYAIGDLLYASALNTLSKLAAGTDGHVLTLAAGVPTWAAAAGGGGTGWGLSGNAVSGTQFIGTTNNYALVFKTNNVTALTIGTSGTLFHNNTYPLAKQIYWDGGNTNRYGVGFANAAPFVQFFTPLASWSWNTGGDLQTAGTNEVMRLTGSGLAVTGSGSFSGNLSVTGLLTIGSLNVPTITAGAVADIVKHYYWDGGTGNKYGVAMNNGSPNVQFFAPTGLGKWSWNFGGDRQASGTNEIMRLGSSGLILTGIGLSTGAASTIGGDLSVTGLINVNGNAYPKVIAYWWNGGAGNRYGMGMASNNPYNQFFAPANSNVTGWSWNYGGDLQTPGTNEIMRISASASAIADFISTTKGFLIPRMTTTQKNAIASPATGLQLFDSTLGALGLYSGAAWNSVLHAVNTMTKTTAGAPYTNDGYVSVNIGGTVYKLMTTA